VRVWIALNGCCCECECGSDCGNECVVFAGLAAACTLFVETSLVVEAAVYAVDDVLAVAFAFEYVCMGVNTGGRYDDENDDDVDGAGEIEGECEGEVDVL
jgi:hypothetical protein